MTQSIYYQIFHYLEFYLNACTNSLIKVTADRNYKSRLVEQHNYYLPSGFRLQNPKTLKLYGISFERQKTQFNIMRENVTTKYLDREVKRFLQSGRVVLISTAQRRCLHPSSSWCAFAVCYPLYFYFI